jgi:hypothetical protein
MKSNQSGTAEREPAKLPLKENKIDAVLESQQTFYR